MSQCAFQFYAKYELQLKERPEWQKNQYRLQGNFLHSFLEKYVKTLQALPKWPEIKKDQSEFIFEEIWSILCQETFWLDKVDLEKNLLKTELKEALQQFIENDQQAIFSKKWIPVQTESPFEIQIEHTAIRFILRGIIDRLDQDSQGRVFLRDYKLSALVSRSKIGAGLSLQLPVYLLYLVKTYGAEKILGLETIALKSQKASGFYAHIPEFQSKQKKYEPKQLLSAVETVEDYLTQLILQRQKESVQVDPKIGACEQCAYASLCRYQTWMQKYQSENELKTVLPLGI